MFHTTWGKVLLVRITDLFYQFPDLQIVKTPKLADLVSYLLWQRFRRKYLRIILNYHPNQH